MTEQPYQPPDVDETTWASIDVAIARIMREMPPIGKDAQMESGPRYKYRSIEAMMPHIATLMARHGVHLEPVYTPESDQQYRSGDGYITRVVIRGLFTFRAADGSCRHAATIGEARDTYDKAYNKAETAAKKYAYIDVFNINEGDDPDHSTPPPAESWETATPAQRAAGRATETAAPAEPPPPNFARLRELAGRLGEFDLQRAVKVWAADQDPPISLVESDPDEPRSKVVAHAEKLIAEAEQAVADVG